MVSPWIAVPSHFRSQKEDSSENQQKVVGNPQKNVVSGLKTFSFFDITAKLEEICGPQSKWGKFHFFCSARGKRDQKNLRWGELYFFNLARGKRDKKRLRASKLGSCPKLSFFVKCTRIKLILESFFELLDLMRLLSGW